NHQLKHFLSGGECALRVERRILRPDADPPAIGGDVLRLELRVDLLLIYAELRQPWSRDFQENGLLLRAEELDTLNARDEEEFGAEKLGVAAEFRKRISVSRNSQEDAEDVSEIVDNRRLSTDRRWQLWLDVVDLATELIPHLGDRVFVIPVLDPCDD